MENQLELMSKIDREYPIGSDIEGQVISKTNDGVNVSLIGSGIDGIIPMKELSSADNVQDIFDSLNIGDTVNAKVIKYRNDDGFVVLSRLEYEKEAIYDKLEDLFNSQSIFTVKVKDAKEKGLVAYYSGVRIFIPASQIDIRFINNKEEFVNQELQVKLIDFDKSNPSRVVASRRVILESERAEVEEKVWSTLKEGDITKVEIKRFTKFGAFADVNGLDGLIHLSQISWSHVRKAEDKLKVGEMVDVKIIGLDKDSKKISLSIKETTARPWDNIDEKYPEGSTVLGTVVRLNDFGAFIELEPGIDALVHISKISHDRINNPSEVLTVGEEVKAKILTVDKEKNRIGLSIKDAQ